jgi:hypothetical protein
LTKRLGLYYDLDDSMVGVHLRPRYPTLKWNTVQERRENRMLFRIH